MKLSPRKAAGNFAPYVAGRPIEEIKRIYKLKKVIKLASNESPYPPSPKVVASVRKLAASANRYPDSNAWALKKALASFLGVSEKCILVGSGADELIELLGKAYLDPGDRIIVSEHAFIRYEMAARLMNAHIARVPMKKLTHNLTAMAGRACKKDKFVFVANPNNPTGTYNTKKEMDEMLSILRKRKTPAIPVFDEAYLDFVSARDYVSALGYFKKGKKVIVLRTLSKIYALAGLRMGYAIAPQEICEVIERIRPPFNTTLVSQAAAIAALSDRRGIVGTRRKILDSKKELEKGLKKIGAEFVPAQTNFLLVKTGSGAATFKKLLRKGVIVRAMDEYGLPEYIRVTVGTPAENKFFLKALAEVIKKKQ